MNTETVLVEAAPKAPGEVSTKIGETRRRCSHAFKTAINKELIREGNADPYTYMKDSPWRKAWDRFASRVKILECVREETYRGS